MMFIFSMVLAGVTPAPVAGSPVPVASTSSELACEIPARWRLLDERVLDLTLPKGTTAVPVTIGCRFLGVPGAVVNLGDESLLTGMSVVGMRRSQGQIIVAANSKQATALNRASSPPAFSLVKDGSWRPLIEAFERLR